MKNFITPILLSLIFSSLAFGQWSTLEMPDGRIQIGGAAFEHQLFIVGGFDGNFNYTDQILVYDAVEKSWNELFLAESRAKIACAANQGKLYCGGGLRFEGPLNYDLVEIIDTQSGEVAVELLSQARTELAAVAVGNKVLFAGGLEILEVPQGPNMPALVNAHDVVDIYDTESQSWTTAQLSEARGGMAFAVAGNKAFFAGGYKGNGEVSDAVDIYDVLTGEWTTETLSQARAFYGGGASNGSQVFFAGGIMPGDMLSDMVDIYDLETQSWSSRTLSEARFGIQAAAMGEHIFFAGGGIGSLEGWSYADGIKLVDVYNFTSDNWALHEFDYTRFNHVCLAAGNQVLVAGGFDSNFLLGGIVDVFTDETISSAGEWYAKQEMDIFPNPVKEELSIRFRTIPAPNSRLYLNDITGHAIPLPQPTKEVMQYSLNGLPAGLYFLNFQDGPEISTVKLVK